MSAPTPTAVLKVELLACNAKTPTGYYGGNAVAIKWHRVLVAEDRTSKRQTQHELIIGANNELHEGSFIRSSSG